MSNREILVSDFEIPGPRHGLVAGAPATPDAPNRIGSAAVPVRCYEPAGEGTEAPWATLVWAHGGSFVHGHLDWPEADWVSRRFAEAGVRVYSVDYLLASESVKAPAPANDLAAVLGWVAAGMADTAGGDAEGSGDAGSPHRSQLLAVGGASAGAHLAVLAALSLAEAYECSDGGRAADALILEYPTLHRVQRDDPALAAATAELPAERRFGAARITQMYDFYLGDAGAAGADAAAAGVRVAGELPRERLALLPATFIVDADADDLRASSLQFVEQLQEAGVTVSEYVQPGTLHGYLNRPDESVQANADARETVAYFVARLRGIERGAERDDR